MKSSFADILSGIDACEIGKLRKKVPSWGETAGLKIPSSLNLEQCSSEATALFKAALAESLHIRRIADLTGGLGVDCWAFSKVAEAVFYNETNPALKDAVEANFRALGVKNAEFHCLDANGKELPGALEKLSPNLAFIDPARRNAAGKKVFRIEECSPDVTLLVPGLLPVCGRIMLKLSPLADITAIARSFQGMVTDIFVVESGGECKEVLCLLEKDDGNADRFRHPAMHAVIADGNGFQEEVAGPCGEEGKSVYANAGKWILVPCAAVSKAFSAGTVCRKFGISRIAPNVNLYTAEEKVTSPFFKSFEVLAIYDFTKENCRRVRDSWPAADVSAKDLGMTGDELRLRIGIKPGGPEGKIHVFGFRTMSGEKKLLVSSVLRKQSPLFH